MSEPNRGACVRASVMLVESALRNLHAAGHLLKAAGMREEEVGVLVANAFLHARRAMPQLREIDKLFPEREAVSPAPPSLKAS